MCYGMVDIKEPLLLIENGGAEFVFNYYFVKNYYRLLDAIHRIVYNRHRNI